MSEKLKVVLLWHMHQPAYYDAATKVYQLPWTYLHAIKDYVDMAAHLEAIPQACAVINFAPTLLEQIDDYVQQIQDFLQKKEPFRDALLSALINDPPHAPYLTFTDNDLNQARFRLIDDCLRANRERLIQRFPPYQQLAEIADWLKQKPEVMTYTGDQYFTDLVVWYHLAWMGETVRREDVRIQTLVQKGREFNMKDRRQLIQIIGELLESIVPRYKKLAEQGQVELSTTPYAHPIVPLLLDVNSAREAMPDVQLPHITNYVDGAVRVRWHLEQALASFQRYFGFLPQGCWPAEGSLSEATICLMERFNIRWTASGETVLRNSLRKSNLPEQIHQPYHLPGSALRCFFRDDNLSDLIGFQFANWHADDAVANLINHLENIDASRAETGACVVPIILDGENAWESYPENGYHFLSILYKSLAEHPQLELTTFGRCLDTVTSTELPTLVAGSWVYGTFSTWIGDEDKNRGWEMLNEVKQVFDRVVKQLEPTQREAAERQLAICEGSDWCWWFGDYNPSQAVNDFDSLYRRHLANLYQLLGETPPDYLQHAFSHGGGDPAVGGTMRRGKEKNPNE